MLRVIKIIVVLVLVSLQYSCNDRSKSKEVDKIWYKGNTHAHTAISGHADSTPDEAAKWYYQNGYDFLILSEHNYFIDPKTISSLENTHELFLLIPGMEITGARDVHTTAMNIERVIPYQFDSSLRSEVIQNHVDEIKLGGGLAILNHPNLHYSIKSGDIKPVLGLHFFELYNGHPNVNNFGDFLNGSTEEMWDDLLSSGMAIYALASDDAHQYKAINPIFSNPGRGWIMVEAANLTTQSIIESIKAGRFYSSNGVILKQCSAVNGTYHVQIDENRTDIELLSDTILGRAVVSDDIGYEIEFIGENGLVLLRASSSNASFAMSSLQEYVRAKVTFRRTNSNGKNEEFYAWCQPVFNDGRESSITDN